LTVSKNVLIVSSNPWGKMFVSKHHYAVALSQLGYRVYFLNPYTGTGEKLSCTAVPEYPGITVVNFRGFKGSYIVRFKARKLYDRFIAIQIRKLFKKLAVRFDEVWSFETNLYSDLRIFKGKKTIYFPADILLYPYQIQIARTADLTVTISSSIKKSLEETGKKIILINHGLAPAFVQIAKEKLSTKSYQNKKNSGISRVGYIGNLVRNIIDTQAITKLVTTYKDIEFHFWGPYRIEDSNLSGTNDPGVKSFIELLEDSPNCILHGATPSVQLAGEMQEMDIFLLTLIIRKNGDYDGSNSHKIMEYLSTGKICIANFNVAAFEGNDAIAMAKDNDAFFPLFEKVLQQLEFYNSAEKQEKRLHFALENSYKNHVTTIHQELYQ
jgi:hypothetical protein